MKQFLKKAIIGDLAYRIMVPSVYLLIIALVVLPIGNAESGEVIVFYRENNQIVGDVGHVGVAIQLEDGTWLGGAVEGPGGIWGITGTLLGNGGWSDDFKTKKDVIAEFASSSHHAAYTAMKSIQVPEIHGSSAKSVMELFDDWGFAIWANNDCYTRVYDAMKAYGVDAKLLHDDGFSVGDKDWLRPPKDFFNDLSGDSKPLSSYKPELSSFLKTPLLSSYPSQTSDMSSTATKGPYVPPTTTKTTVSYSYNVPGKWIMHPPPGASPFWVTFSSGGKAYVDWIGNGDKVLYGHWTQSGDNFRWITPDWKLIGTLNAKGLTGTVGGIDVSADKIGGNVRTKTVVTTVVPSNVAGVGPLGGGGGSW